MKFKLFKWILTPSNKMSLEEYIDCLDEKGWTAIGSTVVRKNDKGDPTKIIIHCVAQPKDGQ